MDIALHLKGLYVKIAQIVSSRPDFVPPVYIDLFVQAQDSLPQWPIADVSRIIDCTLQSNYNVSIDDVFESIDPVALGSASIGQVHRAKFKDTYLERNIDNGYMGGPFAAIKVMHPGAEDTFRHDFQVFRWLCKVALTGWEPILDECYRQIMSEFDYRREAQSLDTVRRSLSRSPFRKLVHVPEPLRSLCTKELLVMEMLQGKKLSDSFEDELRDALGGDPDVAQSFLRKKRLELILGRENMKKLDLQSVGGIESLGTISKIRLLKLYWRVSKAIDLVVNIQGYQILSVGVFNGDPHPGNLLVLDDGRLGLVDFGQVKEISTEERIGVARIVNDLNTGSTEDIANSMRSLGFQTQNDDDSIIVQYAKLFFDSDADGKVMDCPTPQSYFKKLTDADPLTNVPDVAIFVARSSFILRGMGTLLDKQIETSSLWGKYAKAALSEYDATGDHLTAETKVGTVTTEPLIGN
jgi:aarF domain-containing kinase